MADDLNAVIEATGCTTPVVVVGWTSGGLVAEMFAVRHPEKLAGLVLLDPTEMPTGSRLGQYLVQVLGVTQILATSLAIKLGLFRTRAARNLLRRMAASAGTSSAGLDYVENLVLNPPRARWAFAPILPLFFGGYIRETAAALRAKALPDVPVRVLVPQSRQGSSRAWVQHLDVAHRELAQRFPQGKLIAVDRASYYLPIDRPDAVIATVRDVLGLNSTTHDTLA